MKTSGLQQLYVGAVNSELMKRMLENDLEVPYTEEALEDDVRACLKEMVALEQAGETFDHQAYSGNVLEAIRTNTDGQIIMAVFREYCHFQSMVLIAREFRNLMERFRAAGLGSWTKLRVDTKTLRPFAESVIGQLESAVVQGGELPLDHRVEAAELINQISDLYSIPISSELRAMIEWCLEEEDILAQTTEGASARILS